MWHYINENDWPGMSQAAKEGSKEGFFRCWQMCYTQRRRDNFPGTQFFLDKFLFSKKGLGQRIPKQLVELKKVSEFFDGSLSPSENRPLGEKTLSSQMLLELNFFLMVSYI